MSFQFRSSHESVTSYVNLILNSLDANLETAVRHELSTALRELLLNAIEHGNFALSYDDKSKALHDGSWARLINERSCQEPYCSRFVCVSVDSSETVFSAIIRDQGFGFDWRCLPDPTAAENLLNEHGRGVSLARFCVDELVYNETGNEVSIRKHLLP